MVSDSTALVMLAIRSGVKLGLQLRQAFVDAAKQRELVLPLPNFFSSPDIVSAANYFAVTGREHVTPGSQLDRLLQKRQTAGQELSPEEEDQLLGYHTEFFNLDLIRDGKLSGAGDGSRLDAHQFNALITIRQWQRGDDPNPSTLQRLAGSFIEIGIDYFSTIPGALNKDSREGKILAGFLQGMSEIHFSDEQLGSIPARLLVAALETVSENYQLLPADAKVQELVNVTTRTLSADVARRLELLGDTDLVKKEQVGDWAELVFRSLLSSAGGLVLSDPKRYLDVEQAGQAALVSQVGASVLGLVLDNSDLQLDRLFSRNGMETVIKSALKVIGEHPEILVQTDNAGLQKLLASIAGELSQFDTLFTPDLLPELTRMILDKTGDNLALLWPDLANNPQRHLLLTAASTTLEILTSKPAGDQKWTLRFTSADILSVTDTVFDELAANPSWLLNAAGQLNGNLKVALTVTLDVVRSHADDRLSPATGVEILRAVLVSVGQRKEFFDKLPTDIAAAGQPLIGAALAAIFSTIFAADIDARAAWQLVRNETIVEVVALCLDCLAKSRLSGAGVMTFAAFFEQQIELLATGEPLDLLGLETKLQELLAA